MDVVEDETPILDALEEIKESLEYMDTPQTITLAVNQKKYVFILNIF